MIKNLQKNKACPAKLQRSRGFVMLFAVTLAAVFLAMALGLSNIALKELKFSTSAKDTNDAFFAADIGVEKALYLDKIGGVNGVCAPAPCSLLPSPTIISQLGSGQSCVIVTVTKTTSPNNLVTIISKGYNNGGSAPGSCTPGSNSVEREIKVTYNF